MARPHYSSGPQDLDTTVIAAFDDEAKALRLIMIMHQLELKLLRSTNPSLRKVNMDIYSSDSPYRSSIVMKHDACPTALETEAFQFSRFSSALTY